MKSKEEKDTLRTETQDEPKSKEQVLVFSHQLRREVETACCQLDNREGQNNLTINKEVAEWPLVAKKQLKEAFQILKLKNGNNEVGEVLYVQLQNILHRISMNPFIGQTTEIENIRYIIPHPGYTLFYRHSLKKIEVVVLWDNRLKMGELKVIPKKE